MAGKHKWFMCECHTEGIAVSIWEGVNDITVAIWRSGVDSGETRWANRLRHIWHILRYGHPYLDEITLVPAKARELAAYLVYAAHTAEDGEQLA